MEWWWRGAETVRWWWGWERWRTNNDWQSTISAWCWWWCRHGRKKTTTTSAASTEEEGEVSSFSYTKQRKFLWIIFNLESNHHNLDHMVWKWVEETRKRDGCWWGNKKRKGGCWRYTSKPGSRSSCGWSMRAGREKEERMKDSGSGRQGMGQGEEEIWRFFSSELFWNLHYVASGSCPKSANERRTAEDLITPLSVSITPLSVLLLSHLSLTMWAIGKRQARTGGREEGIAKISSPNNKIHCLLSHFLLLSLLSRLELSSFCLWLSISFSCSFILFSLFFSFLFQGWCNGLIPSFSMACFIFCHRPSQYYFLTVLCSWESSSWVQLSFLLFLSSLSQWIYGGSAGQAFCLFLSLSASLSLSMTLSLSLYDFISLYYHRSVFLLSPS